ncbi:hypothetical protein [Vreelandella profundi]|uniref:hypothetical protein n=1 Tax=Vreelandella profundi TaxID=2852117 RepID=UPI001F386824|nr:hypothetical protein [Halomonas profundi]
MTNTLKERILSFRKQKQQGIVPFVRIRGAGVASVDTQGFMESRQVKNVVSKINKAKHDKTEHQSRTI